MFAEPFALPPPVVSAADSNGVVSTRSFRWLNQDAIIEQVSYSDRVDIRHLYAPAAYERRRLLRPFNPDSDLDKAVCSNENAPITLALLPSSVLLRKKAETVTVKKRVVIVCRLCGGKHQTHLCPSRDSIERDIAAASGKKYVPPQVKAGITEKRDYSVRVDPIAPGWTEDNLRDLVGVFRAEVDDSMAALRKNVLSSGAKRAKIEESLELYQKIYLGLTVERLKVPTDAMGRRLSYGYINFSNAEAQKAFAERFNKSRVEDQGIIMNVLLPEEYRYTR